MKAQHYGSCGTLLSLEGGWRGGSEEDQEEMSQRETRGMLCHVMEKAMAPHSSTLAWKIHGRRSLVGCSPWGHWGLNTTERLHFHFSLSRIGEGNGNPLQCSCLENPRDGGAWWAAVYGVAQSWTWLKRLSSSSSNTKSHLGLNKNFQFQKSI